MVQLDMRTPRAARPPVHNNDTARPRAGATRKHKDITSPAEYAASFFRSPAGALPLVYAAQERDRTARHRLGLPPRIDEEDDE